MTIFFAWLLADFISGIVHWWEDRASVGVSRFKFINSVRADNERHHDQPGSLTRYSWWSNINTTAPFAWGVSSILIVSGAPALIYWTTIFLGFGNLVHRWAHESKASRPRVVTFLQRIGLFVSPSHHSGHHFKNGKLVTRSDSRIRFCVMTNWLNPVLDYVGFWRWFEFIFK